MVICNECGGANVEICEWRDANTREYTGDGPADPWCEDCQLHVGIKIINEDGDST